MAQSSNVHDTTSRPTASIDAPWYRRESWLVVFLVACVPLALTIAGPQSLRIPCAAITGVITVVGFAMMLRRTREVDGQERTD